jgi:hypothetical protein
MRVSPWARHETATCTPNYDGVVDFFNQVGFDVMEFNMPLLGCNANPQARLYQASLVPG